MPNIEFIGENDSFKMNYIDAWQFELGECYMDNRNIVYLAELKYYHHIKNAKEKLKNIQYADEQMELFFSAAIPHIFKEFKTIDDKYCLIIKKPTDSFPLKNVLEYFDDEIEGEHIAWIITRLLNIEQFLSYNNIIHNGISLSNIFINPKTHIVTLYGGWWYATYPDELMTGTNSFVYDLLLPETIKTKKPTCYTDLESIKLVGKQISGIITSGFTTLPDSMLNFLNKKSTKDIKKELMLWEKAKEEAYGKPKFIEMKIETNKLFNMKGDN